MNNTEMEIFNNVSSFMPDLESECWGQYAFYISIALFCLSELLPFIKNVKSSEVIDIHMPRNTPKENILSNSNGLIHLAIGLLSKLTK